MASGRVQAFVFADANPYTFGSLLRDRAVVLHGHDAAGPRCGDARRCWTTSPRSSSSGDWYSTQSLAFALVAVAQNTGTKPFKGFSFDYSLTARQGAHDQRSRASRRWPTSNYRAPPAAGLPLAVSNTSDRKLYVTAAVRATPASGEEDASANGLDHRDRLQRRRRQARGRAQAARRAAT